MSFARFRRTALLVVGTLFGTIGTSTAMAQTARPAVPSGACFDVVRAFSGELAGSILINRCSGRTWVMVSGQRDHSDQLAYRWMPVATGGAEVGASPQVPSVRHVPAPISPNSSRCFTFAEKKYCE